MELKSVKGIGPKTIERLNANSIYTPEDLLLFFPKKYTVYQVDNSNAFSGEILCFKAIVASRAVVIKTRSHSRAFVFFINLNGGKHKCVIFAGDYLRFKLQVGQEVICYGKYKIKDKEFSLTSIFFEDFTCRIALDYGIPDIQNHILSKAIDCALKAGITLEDNLPEYLRKKYKLLTINEIVRIAHFPKNIEDCQQIRRRIRYEDFFWYTASLELLRLTRDFEKKSPKIFDQQLIDLAKEQLPYSLTSDQNKALEACLSDLQMMKPMNRLIEGDVGSGKTIVAFLCAIATIASGYQVAMMAPTEILAIQHYESFQRYFPNYHIELLTSSTKQSKKEDILYRLLHGRIDLIIGTHALIQERVLFQNLGLVIIDEQHRFGVNQRKMLVEKFKAVDALYLTATPIPRTLGLTTFGDLDLTKIVEKPANRKIVKTQIVPFDNLAKLAKSLERHLAMDEQIYIVVPLIEESDNLNFIDINQAYDIFAEFLPNAKISLLHGKMKAKDKEEIMANFKQHNIDCLISTTVIEVGVDVKNATVMVILDAERYGLSQIHQLRGRVGRGDRQSYCYLVTKKEFVERLDILQRVNDGFILAEEDFKLRGPGDYLGEQQSGFNSLNFDFSSNDLVIWRCAMEDSKAFVADFLNNKVENKKLAEIYAQINFKKAKIN